jgi:hypothetical protein
MFISITEDAAVLSPAKPGAASPSRVFGVQRK